MYKASIIFSIFLIASVLISGATANSCGLPYYTVDGVLLLSPPYPLQNVSDIAPELTSELSAVMNVANWRLDVYVSAVNTTDNITDLYALFTIVPPSPDTCQTEPDSITAIYTLNTAILYGELPYGYIQWINPSWQLIVPEHAQCYLLDSGLSCDDALFSNSSQPTSTPFPFNTTTPFPFNTSTPFPFNTSTPFPFNTSTPFPFNTTTPFPFNTSTPFPFNTTTPFPFNTSTPFPFNTTTPFPFNTSTPFPFNTTTPRPFNTSTPFPFNTTTPRPFNTSTPFPFNTTTPRPFNTSTPFPFNTTTPRPFNTSTPFPFNTTTPRPFNTSTPFPFNTTTPRPFNTSTPFPFNTTTPRPFNTSTPFPFNTTTPRPFNTSTPFPFNTTTARPFNTSTPFPFNTTTPFPFNTSTPFPFNTSTPFPFNTSTPFPFNTSTAFPFNTTTSTSYPCGPLYTISGALRFVPPINVSVPLEQVFLEMSLAMNVSYSRVTGWAQRPQDAWYVYFTVDAPTNCATEIDSIRAIYALNRTLDAGGRGYRILSWADPNWQLLQPGHADCYYQVSRESCDSVLYQISPSTGRDNSAGSYNILNSINDNTGLSIFLIIVLPIAGFLVGILATCIYARRKQRSLTEKTIQLQQLLLGVEIGSTTVQPGKFEPMHA